MTGSDVNIDLLRPYNSIAADKILLAYMNSILGSGIDLFTHQE